MGTVLQPLSQRWHPHLRAIAQNLGDNLSEDCQTRIASWLDLLVTWNAKLDLTAARTPQELCELMVADALVLAHAIPDGASVVDVGTGAGAPGFALALIRPDLRMTLVEPLQKRIAFLRTCIGQIEGANGITAVRARGEDLVARGEKFDVAMARAVLSPASWLELGGQLVVDDGAVWVLLAREPAPSLASWEVRSERSYLLLHNRAGRTAVAYCRGRAAAENLPAKGSKL